MSAQGGAVVTPQELAERALALSTTDGCIAIVREFSTANLRWANNTLTTNGVNRSRNLTVIAVAERAEGASVGAVSRSGGATGDLDDLVSAAEAKARALTPAEDAAPLLAGGPGEDFGEAPGETSIQVFQTLAPALGEAFQRAGASGRNLYGYAEHDVTTTYLATSKGLRLRYQQPSGTVELTGRSLDGSRSAWVGQPTRDFADVDAASLDATIAARLEWAKRRIELPAGRYETLLPPSAVGDLMCYLYWSSAALDAHEGHTVFSRPGGGTRVGERLAPSLPLNLRSDPGRAGVQCAPFLATTQSFRLASVFDNGLAAGPTDWIREGTLQALVQTRHSARVTGLPVTPMVDNLLLEVDEPGAGRDLDGMVAAMQRGLLLTTLWYIREVDPQTLLLTGLTRDGVFLVEDGEVTGAVNNFRFNESPVDLLGRLAEVGPAEPTLPREFGDYFTRVAMPPVRVADFNMSSVSQAS